MVNGTSFLPIVLKPLDVQRNITVPRLFWVAYLASKIRSPSTWDLFLRVSDLYFVPKQDGSHKTCGNCSVGAFGQDWHVTKSKWMVFRGAFWDLTEVVSSVFPVYTATCESFSLFFLSWFPLTLLNNIPDFLPFWGIGGISLSYAKQK